MGHYDCDNCGEYMGVDWGTCENCTPPEYLKLKTICEEAKEQALREIKEHYRTVIECEVAERIKHFTVALEALKEKLKPKRGERHKT
jgi:hypothetical protein